MPGYKVNLEIKVYSFEDVIKLLDLVQTKLKAENMPTYNCVSVTPQE